MGSLGIDYLALAIAMATGSLALSMGLDRLVRPGGAGILRPPPAAAIHAGLFFIFLSSAWLVTSRPGFAAALTLAGQGMVVAISNAKYRALREPFVYSDVVLFSQVFRFPRLYLPFLGISRAVLALFGLGTAIAIGLLLETPWPSGRMWALLPLGTGLILLVVGTHTAPKPSLEPVEDLADFGLFTSLWLYTLTGLAAHPTPPKRTWLDEPVPSPAANPLPDLILLQSESFFDARRLYPGVRSDLLAGYDELRNRSLAHGRLAVPAWGANTMRTEFAVLTGIAQDLLGVHRFNPYLSFARHGLPALPHRLRSLGYRTVCIHPHPAGFFGRDRVFPGLGFDTFIDLAGFAGAPHAGPYVADAAVTRKIAEVLEACSGPIFVFVITMENHGPLHLERVESGEVNRLYSQPPRMGWDDLTVYLRHLVNADRMFQNLDTLLAARPSGGLLCLYGDHVPSMPQVYEDLGYTDPCTDYLILSTNAGPGRQLNISAHQLPETLLTLLGQAVVKECRRHLGIAEFFIGPPSGIG